MFRYCTLALQRIWQGGIPVLYSVLFSFEFKELNELCSYSTQIGKPTDSGASFGQTLCASFRCSPIWCILLRHIRHFVACWWVCFLLVFCCFQIYVFKLPQITLLFSYNYVQVLYYLTTTIVSSIRTLRVKRHKVKRKQYLEYICIEPFTSSGYVLCVHRSRVHSVGALAVCHTGREWREQRPRRARALRDAPRGTRERCRHRLRWIEPRLQLAACAVSSCILYTRISNTHTVHTSTYIHTHRHERERERRV